MSLRTRIDGMPKRTRRVVGAALALVLVAGGTLAVWAALDGGRAPRGQTSPDGDAMAGMNMEATAPAGDGTILVGADRIRTFGVTFGFVERRTLENEIRTVGIVAFDETRVTAVTPKVGGYVERLYVDFTGRTVRAGEALLEIYSPELVAAQEELLVAARLQERIPEGGVPGVPAGSSDLVGAARRRLRLWDISEAQIDRVLAAGRAQRTLVLHAPVSGIVVEKDVLAGSAIQAGQRLYTIADLSRIWIEAELREADAAAVREGDPATVEIAALADRPITGRVEYVSPTLQSASRSLRARISVNNPGGRLKPGMFATVRITAASGTVLAVPLSAVLNTGERHLVFVDAGQGRIGPREVRIGRSGDEYVEVIGGLEAGERVVTSAQYLLDSESNLAQTMKSMIGMNPSDAGSMEGMDMGGGADARGADMRGIDTSGRKER